jgi:hypothetical protein
MIKEGQKKKARYWGDFQVQKVSKLKAPVICESKEVGQVEFMPTLVKIDWATSPSLDKNEFWFPYWVKIKGKEKYGQFAPMIGQKALLELLKEAIKQDFFDKDFLLNLSTSIQEKLQE